MFIMNLKKDESEIHNFWKLAWTANKMSHVKIHESKIFWRIMRDFLFSFSILKSFFRKPLVDKTVVVDGFTRAAGALECQKYWWGQAYPPLPPWLKYLWIIYLLQIESPYVPKPFRRLCGGWWGERRNSSYVIVVLTVSNCCCKEFSNLQLYVS